MFLYLDKSRFWINFPTKACVASHSLIVFSVCFFFCFRCTKMMKEEEKNQFIPDFIKNCTRTLSILHVILLLFVLNFFPLKCDVDSCAKKCVEQEEEGGNCVIITVYMLHFRQVFMFQTDNT